MQRLHIYVLILSLLCSQTGQGWYKHLCRCVSEHSFSFFEKVSGQLSGKCCPKTCCSHTHETAEPVGFPQISQNCCDVSVASNSADYFNEHPSNQWKSAKFIGLGLPEPTFSGFAGLRLAWYALPTLPLVHSQGASLDNQAHAPPPYNRLLINLIQNYRC